MTFHVEEIRLEIRGEAKVLARFGTSAADALEFKDRAREALRHIWGANFSPDPNVYGSFTGRLVPEALRLVDDRGDEVERYTVYDLFRELRRP
jgi:hypothetical protein